MNHILLPTDFSENSWNSIKYALQLFKNEKCMFYLLNTYTPIIYNVEHVLGYPAQFGLGDAIRTTSQNNLKEMVFRISNELGNNPNHAFETTARFDTLISGIREFTDNKDIDLIVMGTKGATGSKEVLFGSNTVHVFKYMRCPVLAIPYGFDYEAPHEILFPTDLDAIYKHTYLDILKELAIANHSRINAIHVSAGKTLSEKQEVHKLKLETIFKDSAFIFHDIKGTHITKAISEFQVKHKINLLAMINNKHSFFENLFFKNTINQIGFHLNVPFLVIPLKNN